MRKTKLIRRGLAALLGALLLVGCGVYPAERTESPEFPSSAPPDATPPPSPTAVQTSIPTAVPTEEPKAVPTERPNTKSLGERLEGKYACRLDESGELENYYTLEIFNLFGNLYAQGANIIAEEDRETLEPYSFWAMELIPREAGAFLRTDIDECEVGILTFSVMSNLGKYWGAPEPCILRLTVDGVAFLGLEDRSQPLTGDTPRLELLRDERVADAFPALQEVLMEDRGISIPAGLCGLWALEEDIPLYLEFNVDGVFQFWQKNPGQEVLLRRGGYTVSAPGELSGLYCQLGRGGEVTDWVQDYRLEEEGTKLTLFPSAAGDGLLTRTGPAVFRRVTEENVDLPLLLN